MTFKATKMCLVALAVMAAGTWMMQSNAAEEPGGERPARDSEEGASLKLSSDFAPAKPSYPRQAVPPAPPVASEVAAKILAGGRHRTSLAGSIRAAAEAVRDSKGDEAKADAQKTLSELLGKYFDEDMKRRQQELTQIEDRLTKLRELLERRLTKKQDILELQTRVALNEADGLGFYDDAQPGRSKGQNDIMIRTQIPFGIETNWEPVPHVELVPKVDSLGTPKKRTGSDNASPPGSKSNVAR